MVSADDVRRMALALPDVVAGAEADRLNLSIAGKGVAWTYLERVAPKRPRRPRLDVLAVRCPVEEKEMLIAAAPAVYFDDDHYRGYPAVLVRLDQIDAVDLRTRLERAADLQRSARRSKPPKA